MLLAAGTLTEFLDFLQIFSWITIPLLFSAVLITTIVHYRKKKKRAQQEEKLPADFLLSFNENAELAPIPADHAMKVSLTQLSQFRKKLFFSNARYSVLKKDLDRLEEKYNSLLHSQKDKKLNSISMENQNDLGQHIDILNGGFSAEKEELIGHIDILAATNKKLDEENKLLKEKLTAYNNNDGNDELVIAQLQLEKAALKNKINELEFLEDMVEEKKLQIDFLQQQLEQRVRSYHHMEQQFADANVDFMEARNLKMLADEQVNMLQEELKIKRDQDFQLQTIFEDNNARYSQLNEELRQKNDQLVYTECLITELRVQNEELNASREDKEDIIKGLEVQLLTVEEKISRISGKLDHNRRLMARLHTEVTTILEDDEKVSPVIIMKPDYSLSGDEITETATN